MLSTDCVLVVTLEAIFTGIVVPVFPPSCVVLLLAFLWGLLELVREVVINVVVGAVAVPW